MIDELKAWIQIIEHNGHQENIQDENQFELTGNLIEILEKCQELWEDELKQ